jgi:hypothetical protein
MTSGLSEMACLYLSTVSLSFCTGCRGREQPRVEDDVEDNSTELHIWKFCKLELDAKALSCPSLQRE